MVISKCLGGEDLSDESEESNRYSNNGAFAKSFPRKGREKPISSQIEMNLARPIEKGARAFSKIEMEIRGNQCQ
jgi:hypothetical protein